MCWNTSYKHSLRKVDLSLQPEPNLVSGSLKQVDKQQPSLEGFYRTWTKDSLKILKMQSTPKKDPRFKKKDSQQ